MKKRALPLLLAVLLCLTGCGSFLQREWYEVKDHSSSYYEGSGRGVLQADTYQDLVNDILLLVGNHTEEGTIRLYYGGEGLDATDAAEMACREVEHDTPLGSYAVEYLQYTLDDSARNYSEITVTISYRCTAQQMASIAHVTNTSALRDLLAQAQDEGLAELVVQFSSTDRYHVTLFAAVPGSATVRIGTPVSLVMISAMVRREPISYTSRMRCPRFSSCTAAFNSS